MIWRHAMSLDVSAIELPGVSALGAHIVVDPAALAQRPDPPVLVCFAGGAMTRAYFDLQVPSVESEAARDAFSFAVHLARDGFVVVAVDHPGIGSSDLPADGWELFASTVARVEVEAVRHLRAGLRSGALVPELSAMSTTCVVGVGHSMGAMLVAHQQSLGADYDGLVLLGHSGAGVVQHLTDEEKKFIDDPDGLRAALPSLARRRFFRPLVGSGSAVSEALTGPPTVESVGALAGSRAPLIAMCGLAAMIPGSHRPELVAVAVPTFAGIGDHDICGPAGELVNYFAPELPLTVVEIADCFHNHNVSTRRVELWDAIAGWIDDLATDRAADPGPAT